jgi:predicted RNA-binding protein Jag
VVGGNLTASRKLNERNQMLNYNLPKLQRMKQNIMMAVASYSNEIGEYIKKYLEEVIENFDFETEIKRESEKAIHQVINEYFKTGEDRWFIKKQIGEFLEKIFKLE